MKSIITIFLLSIVAGHAFSQNTEGFDYRRGKIEGKATVAGRWAAFQITGDAAEAIYYQMSGTSEMDTGCSPGETKRMPGLMCTKITDTTKQSRSQFECFIDINLHKGQIEESSGMCPDDDMDASLEAKGFKFPRSPDQRTE